MCEWAFFNLQISAYIKRKIGLVLELGDAQNLEFVIKYIHLDGLKWASAYFVIIGLKPYWMLADGILFSFFQLSVLLKDLWEDKINVFNMPF